MGDKGVGHGVTRQSLLRLLAAFWLLSAGGLIHAGLGDTSGADAPDKSSDKGLSPNASITSVSGLEVDTYKLNLMFNVPMTPTFKVADGVSYGVSARYSSNIFSPMIGYRAQPSVGTIDPEFSYIPTLKSPFGAGFEFGFGLIYLDYQGHEEESELQTFKRQFVLQTPDGSSHQLYLLASHTPDVSPHLEFGAGAVGGEPLGGHLKGDTYITKNLSPANQPWVEQFNPAAEYYTADGSLIRAIYHQATSLFGSPAFWEIFYPDGRKVVYSHPFTPDADGIQGKYYKRCAASGDPATGTKPNLNNDYPQEMLGWYPTRVENARGVGFTLYYENTDYPYLVSRIGDDTDRRNFGGTNADIHFTIGALNSGVTAGRYTDISYPGANGTQQSIHLNYVQQAATYRRPDGVIVSAADFPGLDPAAFAAGALQLTLLKSVQMPGGYVETFTYNDESVVAGNAPVVSGRLKRIDIPTGGVHTFDYQLYDFDVGTSTGDYPRSLGIASHTLKVRDGAVGAADTMVWNYRQSANSSQNQLCGSTPGSLVCNVQNVVTDPAGNETAYLFDGGGKGRARFSGTLRETDFYQGTLAGGLVNKRVKNSWHWFNVGYNTSSYPPYGSSLYSDPDKPQIVKTTTEFVDDPVGGAPGTLIEENLGWDYWGHFTIKQTSGTLVPKMRRTVTNYSLDRSLFAVATEPIVDLGSQTIANSRENVVGRDPVCSQVGSGLDSLALPDLAHWVMKPGSNCPYLADALTNWRISLPLSVELQEFDGVNWVTKSRAETRYDLATGLPTRTVARLNPGGAGAATGECTAAIAPQAGDVVSDFYYDNRGNLALKKVYGADDTAVFRTYMGTGDKPAAASAPGSPATIGPDGSENIYSNAGGYFGFDRWSREFSPTETAPHLFVNSFTDTADLETTSGAIIFSHDANSMTSKTEYDSIGRVNRKTFLGDQSPGAGDKPVDYSYVDIDLGAGVKQLVSLKSVQEDTNHAEQRIETQDYYDGLGRKVISRRLNPDGNFAWQVMHYDLIGHADLVSNWSFATPPGLNDDGTVSDATQWTDGPLSSYIFTAVRAYTKTCYTPACTTLAGNYEFAGRPLRTERVSNGGSILISRVDTEYFGFNTRVKTYGLNSTDPTAPGAITTHYTDGYGNLRVVDVDNDGTASPAAGAGVDAIYDYDYANRLVKVNLVPQVTLTPFAQGGDRYATANGDNQTRYFTFDSLGRQIQAQNQENGITKYLKFNALGQVLEAEDENGRIGGGPSGGVFSDTLAKTPNGNGHCPPAFDNYCKINVKIDSGSAQVGGEVTAAWTALGKQFTTVIPPEQLFYQVSIDGTVVVPFTLGMQTWHGSGLSISSHSLVVTAAYFATQQGNEPNGTDQLTISEQTDANAYHLTHQYDSRGRELFVRKQPVANGLPSGAASILRQFDYEAGSDCASSRSCGKLVTATSLRVGTSNVVQSFKFRTRDGRMDSQSLQAQQLSGYATYPLGFDYDNFGRQNQATYPDGRQIKLIFQSGGVKSVNNVAAGNVLVPYATMGRLGDYNADGSLATFLQGNGLTFHRYIDDAERVMNLCYNDVPGNTPLLSPCQLPVGNHEVWNSGFYRYDGTGNIMAIGDFTALNSFTHDRLNRLLTATIQRHPHLNGTMLEPAGFVAMSYDYDVYGNITKRYQTNTAGGVPYLAGSDPAERFGAVTARDYTNGPVAADNKIHDTGFLYDGNGNLVSDGKKDFLYDVLNQQIEVYDALTRVTYNTLAQIPANRPWCVVHLPCVASGLLIENSIYGADGMRAVRQVMRTTAGSGVNRNTVFTRLGGNVVKEYTEEFNAGTPQTSHEKAYIYGPLGLLATEELCNFNCDANAQDVAGATTRYYEYDHLGTVRAITTATGVLQSTFDYEPFGLELKGTTTWYTDASSNTHRFTGHERDEEAGEDYMKARMYVLSTARFPQVDPMFGGAGDPQNWNSYIYVDNSPVGAGDPTGMATPHEHGAEVAPPPAQSNGGKPIWDSYEFSAYNGAGNTLSQDLHILGYSGAEIKDAGEKNSVRMTQAFINFSNYYGVTKTVLANAENIAKSIGVNSGVKRTTSIHRSISGVQQASNRVSEENSDSPFVPYVEGSGESPSVFEDPLVAGIIGVQYSFPLRDRTKWEWGGAVLLYFDAVNRQFGFVFTSRTDCTEEYVYPNVPHGPPAPGTFYEYHLHVRGKINEDRSDQDEHRTNKYKVSDLLGTPTNAIKLYVPNRKEPFILAPGHIKYFN